MASYPTTSVAYGQTSNDVKILQLFLQSQGMSIPSGATGYFGDQTKAALTQWQTSHGITGAGVGTNWGPQSIAKAQSTSSGGSSGSSNMSTGSPTNMSVGSTSAPSGGMSPYTTPYGSVPNNSSGYGGYDYAGPQTPQYDPSDLNSMQSAYQSAISSSNYQLAATLQAQINAETQRQQGIKDKAQQLVSGMMGTKAINDYYSSLSPKDQGLVKGTFGSNLVSGYKTAGTNIQQTTQSPGGVSIKTSAHQPLDPSILHSISASTLGPNMSNDPAQVRALQQALVNAGYMTQAQMDTGPGTYGPQTTAAVAAWQTENGINPQGNPGYFGSISKAFISSQGSGISPTTGKSDLSGGGTGTTLPFGTDGLGDTTASTAMNQPGLLPSLVPGTPEYQAAMDKLSTSYYDILQQQMNAQTEQDQQVAEYNWQNLKSAAEKNLNISLSNDAFQAWGQIQNLNSSYGQQNIENSGLKNEAIDSYLSQIRQKDAATRTSAQSDDDKNQMAYYKQFATPAQIQAFAAANPDKAQAWGLVPSDDVKNAMNYSALKAKYPNMSDQDIQANIASVLDENGNYRSDLYQKYMVGGNVGINGGQVGTPMYHQYDANGNGIGNPISIPVTPGDTGVLDIDRAKETYQKLNVPLNNPAAISGASIIQSQSPNSSTPPPQQNPPPTSTPPLGVTGGGGLAAAGAAAGNLGSGSTGASTGSSGSSPATAPAPATPPKSGGQLQYYKLQNTGDMYSKDLSSGAVQKVTSIPTGAGVINWTGSGTPYGLNIPS